MKNLLFASMCSLCAIASVTAQQVTEKYKQQHVAVAKSVVSRVTDLSAANPKNEILRDASAYFAEQYCVGYILDGSMTMRFFQSCAKQRKFSLLPLLQQDTARLYQSSHAMSQPSRFPSFIGEKNIVYVFGGHSLTDIWVSLHLARAAIEVYLQNKYSYDLQGTTAETEQIVLREQGESMLLYALADAPLRHALDSTKEVFLEIMQKADPRKPFGTYFPNSSHVRFLCAQTDVLHGVDEARYREQLIWRALCFAIIDDFPLSVEEKQAQKIKFDRAAFKKKKQK